MKPLATLKFMKGSIRKILPLAVTVSLSVALLYFLAITVNNIINQNILLAVSPLSNMSILTGSGVKVSQEDLAKDLEKLRANRDIRQWFVSYPARVNFKTPSSNNDMSLFLMKSSDIPQVMKWQKQHLVEGRMPANAYEIILHKNLAQNRKVMVGAIVKKGAEDWYNLPADLKVVGLFDGTAIMGLGAMDEKVLGQGSIAVLTLAEDDSVHAMNQFVENSFGSRYTVQTQDMLKRDVDDKNKNIRFILNFVSVIIVIVLSVLLGNICMIQYTQRSKEFELLYALGYTKKYIALKALKEIGSSTAAGYVLGILLAIFSGWLVNICMVSEKALEMSLVQMDSMGWILLVPLLVTLAGMVVPMKILRFKDLI